MLPRPLALILVPFTLLASTAHAQLAGTEVDLRRLRTELHRHALELLARDGITFYALGAFVEPDGTLEEFATDHWPDLQAPPQEWGDSLVATFHRSQRPARAVAMLVDQGLVGDSLPRDTAAVFHGETGTHCQDLLEAIRGLGLGGAALGWGPPSPQPCHRRFMAASDSSR